MVTVSLIGLVCAMILFISSCSYLYRVPYFRSNLFSSKKGAFGLFYKCAVIGTRLDTPVAAASAFLGILILFYWKTFACHFLIFRCNTTVFRLLNLILTLSAFEILNDVTLIIQNWLASKIFSNIFYHLDLIFIWRISESY